VTLLLENGWTDAQSWGVFGVGEGVGFGVGVGVGVGFGVGVGVGFGVLLGSGVGLVLGDGSVAEGLGSLPVGVAVALALGVGLALGDALALALADALGAAEAAMTAALIASVVPALAITAGRLAHALVVLIRVALDACAVVRPAEPPHTSISPATAPSLARPNVPVVIVAPSSRCRPKRRRRSFVPYLATLRMSRLTHSCSHVSADPFPPVPIRHLCVT
jgi:hypothetical protein